MPYVYKITNQINQKIYIGKTVSTIEKRWHQHIREARKERSKNRPLYQAMNKYGIENFKIEMIEECSVESLNYRECYWIEYYSSFREGYNATKGGDGTVYLDYDLIYKTYLFTKSVQKTSELCNCDIHSVSLVLDLYNIDRRERKSNAQNSVKKPVAQIDPTTKEIVAVYESIADAKKAVPNTYSHISSVCRGKRKTAGGYEWRYI